MGSNGRADADSVAGLLSNSLKEDRICSHTWLLRAGSPMAGLELIEIVRRLRRGRLTLGSLSAAARENMATGREEESDVTNSECGVPQQLRLAPQRSSIFEASSNGFRLAKS